jgi:hypothetical protein
MGQLLNIASTTPQHAYVEDQDEIDRDEGILPETRNDDFLKRTVS